MCTYVALILFLRMRIVAQAVQNERKGYRFSPYTLEDDYRMQQVEFRWLI